MITCAPHYPTGRVLAGYRNRVRQVETVEGIRVVRVGTYLRSQQGCDEAYGKLPFLHGHGGYGQHPGETAGMW